ncbi:AT hook motif family protein [Colletotrichum higginsianum]|nr:AT hook motif family protein [Colletotrichum higginsianum]
METNDDMRPEPPVLERDGFQLSQDKRLTVAGIERMDSRRVAVLLHPEHYPDKIRTQSDRDEILDETRRLFVKPWFAAKASLDRLWKVLEKAVDSGKCDVVPEAIERMQQRMRRDYEVMFHEWEDQARSWDAAKERHGDEAFARCTTPGQKANCDMDRFLEYYFLTDGKPDATKTPRPLALRGLTNLSKFQASVGLVPDLHAFSVGYPGTTCIGWDYTSVVALAYEEGGVVPQRMKETPKIGGRAPRANVTKTRDAIWEETMESHRRYVSQRTGHDKKRGKRAAFDTEQCKGSYIIRCKAADAYNEDTGTRLTLDISITKGGTHLAAHDFGLFEGTMVLSHSEEKLKFLDDIEGEQDSEASQDDYESDDRGHESDSADDLEQNEPSLAQKVASGKRKATSAAESGPTKQKGKKQKKSGMVPSLSRRVYYRMRGRETGEGMIHVATEAGHLNFLDDQGAEFVGLAYEFPYIGRNVEFRGYKISDAPRKKPEPWGSFSSAAYEYARAARW